MAFQNGLLIIASDLTKFSQKVPHILRDVTKHVRNVLYVQIHPLEPLCSQSDVDLKRNLPNYKQMISSLYLHASKFCHALDVRFLLHNLKSRERYKVSNPIDVCIFDSVFASSDLRSFTQSVSSVENDNLQLPEIITLSNAAVGMLENLYSNSFDGQGPSRVYKSVAVGGTFDRLHNGHKLLLSIGSLCATDILTVGVSNGEMLSRKKLCEFIAPCETRIEDVRNFLHDTDNTLKYNILPLTDVAGPTAFDPEIQALVVTPETLNGGKQINQIRRQKNFPELDHIVVSLLPDEWRRNPVEEEKLSSSSLRMRMLGTLLKKPVAKPHLAPTPYVIGLTGGSCSGKSTISRFMYNLGAEVIDCDKLGHQCYAHGSKLYHEILQEFGPDVLLDGEINRDSLKTKVFQNPGKVQKLKDMTWPAIRKMVEDLVLRMRSQGQRIVVIDAALLLEANWDEFCHEIWICIVPREEALRRMQRRDGISLQIAEGILNAQMSNQERVSRANVVFCSLWNPELTEQQVERAWFELQDRAQQAQQLAS